MINDKVYVIVFVNQHVHNGIYYKIIRRVYETTLDKVSEIPINIQDFEMIDVYYKPDVPPWGLRPQ